MSLTSKILALHENGVSNRQIAIILGTNEWSMRNFLKNYIISGSLERKTGSGRPKLLNERDERLLKRISLRNRFSNAGQVRKIFQKQTGKRISIRTMQIELNKLGMEARKPAKKPLLSKKMKSQRLKWANTCKNWTVEDC
ncbi:uncharacterized protein LOC129606946 [Condylostylus longicornis]|uniref:uncharacterized protein LOC129606946 n=1 Tax=Condylostylus longicornis TaxID=2530218 RepID=UPI00244DBB2E|nr:uncharacterized protein LOC129606946 [Condylostylus longicornis]